MANVPDHASLCVWRKRVSVIVYRVRAKVLWLVAYEWLQFVNLRGGNFPNKLLLQYRMPEQAGVVPQTLSLNLNRIKPSSAAGNQVWLNSAGNALELAEEIRNRCQPGQLYGKLMY